MKIYKAKDYKDMSRKGSEHHLCTGDHETKLCTGTGNRIYTDRNL